MEESKGERRRVEESAGVLEKERAGKRAGERRGLPDMALVLLSLQLAKNNFLVSYSINTTPPGYTVFL